MDTSVLPDDSPRKQCRICKHWFPATLEYFHVQQGGKNGLKTRCKQCAKLYEPRPVLPEGMKRCAQCKRILPADTEHFEKNAQRLTSRCKPCLSEYKKERHAKNGEKRRQHDREQYRANPEKIKERSKAHRQKNPEYYRQHNAEYKQRPGVKEYLRAHHKDYYKEYYQRPEVKVRRLLNSQKPEARAQRRAYRQNNPGQMRANHHRRRSRLRSAPGNHTGQDIKAQYKRQKGKCYWCGKKLGKYQVDHIVPLSRGGSNDPSNLVISCPPCNHRKRNKLPHEWDGSGGRLL